MLTQKVAMRDGKNRHDTAGAIRIGALALSLALLASTPARAEPATVTGDKGTDMVLDLLILRPLGLLATGIGSAVFVVALPFTLPGGNTGEAACELVRSPFAYTFSRPLGEMDTEPRDCQERVPR